MGLRSGVGIDGRRCAAACRWRAGGRDGGAFPNVVERGRGIRHRKRMRGPRRADGVPTLAGIALNRAVQAGAGTGRGAGACAAGVLAPDSRCQASKDESVWRGRTGAVSKSSHRRPPRRDGSAALAEFEGARLFLYARCRSQVLICPRCDRGQQHCRVRSTLQRPRPR